MLSIVTIPSVTELLTYGQDATDTTLSLSDQAQAIFSELLPYALAVLGMILGALLVRFIVLGGLKGAVTKLTGRGRRGGRRRRR